jgi:DNA-binding LacI/PurR family transcriptional regulator
MTGSFIYGLPACGTKPMLLASSRVQMPSRSATPPLPRRHSLVAQTVESLCAGIRSGYWREYLPGERELCEHLEVSRRTIGAALHELERQGWLEVTQRQRRRIARRHRKVATGDTRRSIAILAASPVEGLPQQTLVMMDALKERLTKAGYTLDFHVNPACFSAHPARALEKLVAGKPASVWVQFGSADPTQQWFAEKAIPSLLLGTGQTENALPSADSDHRAACRHAGGVLLGRGHLRIAIVLPQGRRGGDLASEEGMREAIARHAGAQLRVLRHNGTAAHLCSVLDSALRDPLSPTAYLVARPTYALTVMMHLMRRGRRIPEDVAVIARDDDTYLQAASPPLTRYAVDSTALARRIAQAVRQLAEGGTLPARAIRLMPTFVPGGSV